MWIRVHPYKATHFENRKSILHFIAFMVLHKDFHHNCYRLTNLFQNTVDLTIVLVVHTYNMIAHFTIFSFLLFYKNRPDSTGVMWLKMERLWYVKKSEVWKKDDNKYCITVSNQHLQISVRSKSERGNRQVYYT